MDCDTKEGIEAQLGSYESFYTVMNVRRSRHVNNPVKHLSSFAVMGRFYTDKSGNCYRLNREVFTDEDRSQMPVVMSKEEFWTFVTAVIKPRMQEEIRVLEDVLGFKPSFPLAPPGQVCARCGGPFELDQCHQTEGDGGFETIDLSPFVGKTLRETQETLTSRTDGVWRFHRVPSIQPNRHSAPLPSRPWLSSKQEGWRCVEDEYVILAEDTAQVSVDRYYHASCYQQVLLDREAAEEQTFIDEFKEVLNHFNFQDMRMIRTSAPKHIRPLFLQIFGDDPRMDLVMQQIPYYRIGSAQGSFGLIKTEPPMIDLEGTGIEIQDLIPDIADYLPKDMSAVIPYAGDAELLLRLWQQLILKSGKIQKS